MKWIIIILLMIIWISLAFFIINYAEAVKKDPCSVCAKRMGNDYVCTSLNYKITFYPNGTKK